MNYGQVQSALEEVRNTLAAEPTIRESTTNETGPKRSAAQQQRVAPTIRSGQEILFVSLWSYHIPLIVTETTSKMQCAWTPEEFVASHGDQRVEMATIQGAKTVTRSVTVEQFFDLFRRDQQEQGYAVKVKVLCHLSLILIPWSLLT